MYALLTEKADGTLGVEIYVKDLDTGEDLPIAFYDGGVPVASTRFQGVHEHASELLQANGFHQMGPWSTTHRAPVERAQKEV